MNNEKKFTIIIILMIIILIAGGLSLFFYSKAKFKAYYFKYGDFDVHKVVSRNGIWYDIKIFVGEENPQPHIFSVRNDPRGLENITVDINNLKNLLIKPSLFITMDKGATGLSVVAGMEISKIVGNKFLYGVSVDGALTKPLEKEEVIVKTCDDANKEIGIIYLKQSDIETKIYNENECVIIEGKDEYELIKGADRLVLTLLGVMKK